MLPPMRDGSKVVAGRYRVDRELWQGPHTRSLLVTDLRNGRPCVMRRLAVAGATPESVRRYETQAAVLARLDHPGLPRFIDGFFEGEGDSRERVLVTSYHPGESLSRFVDKGRPLSETQALPLLRRLVAVLAYLHGFDPPLVHRTIPATGIVVGPDGRPCLTSIDYAVAEADRPEPPPSPPGPDELALAAPEVYMGSPVPASDIYALGLTVVRGMTAQDPAGLVGEDSRTRLRDALGISEGFAALLSRMLEPSLEKRYADVAALEADLERLAGGRPLSTARQQERAVEEPSVQRSWGRPLLALAAVLILAALVAAALKLKPSPPPADSLIAPSAPREQAGAPPPAAVAAPESAPLPLPEGAAPPPTVPEGTPAAESAAPPTTASEGAPPAESPVSPVAAAEPAAPEAAEAAPVAVAGRVLLDGKPYADPGAPAPSFWFRNEDTKKVFKPDIAYADGEFSVRGLPPGRYGMSVRIDREASNPNIFPGDLNAWSDFTVEPGEQTAVDAHLRRIIRLLQPVDNNALITGWDVPCGGGSTLPERVVFAWESLGPGVRYLVSVDRLDCARGYAQAGRVFSGSIAEAWAKVELAPSREGECYSFRLSATKDERPAGVMATHGAAGLGWDYRFRVAP